jgi:hypothetical protein
VSAVLCCAIPTIRSFRLSGKILRGWILTTLRAQPFPLREWKGVSHKHWMWAFVVLNAMAVNRSDGTMYTGLVSPSHDHVYDQPLPALVFYAHGDEKA